ncbi:MAG: hypothetical protein ABSA76_06260 [Bacteroidales bacterium]
MKTVISLTNEEISILGDCLGIQIRKLRQDKYFRINFPYTFISDLTRFRELKRTIKTGVHYGN